MKEFATIFFNEFIFVLDYINMPREKIIPWWMQKFMANTMSKESILYPIAFKNCDG